MIQLPRQLSFHKIVYARSDDCYQSSFVSIPVYSKNNTYKFQQKVKVAAPLRKWMFGFLMIVL